MIRPSRLAPVALGVPLALTLLAGPALAVDGSATATLSPVVLNGSQGTGLAVVTVRGDEIEYTLTTSGLADGPHAAHIHVGADARHECPRAADDTGGDARLSTSEGARAYGPIQVSLTRTGDTGPDSGTAVDRFASGTEVSYSRGRVAVSPAVAAAVLRGEALTVVHGVSYTGTRARARSDLDPSLPASTTDPALCGRLVAAPSGGVATGAGGSAATSDPVLVALGGAALVAAAGTGALVVRRSRS